MHSHYGLLLSISQKIININPHYIDYFLRDTYNQNMIYLTMILIDGNPRSAAI